MKKIGIIMLLIVSLMLPQNVEGAEDEPYNPWTSCARNFVKYSNKGEYCIIVECSGGTKDIQYILIHDIANRNPMIYDGGLGIHYLNLYDTSRYEVYYSDYVQSLTGLSSVFSGDKLALGVTQPTSRFRAEIVRTNYTLFNLNGQAVYDPNYISEVTEFYGEEDKPDVFGIPFDCPYTISYDKPIMYGDTPLTVRGYIIARVHNLDTDEITYPYKVAVSTSGYPSWNFTGQYKVQVVDGVPRLYLELNQEYKGWSDMGVGYGGTLESDTTLSGWASSGVSLYGIKYPDSERCAVYIQIGNKNSNVELTGLNFVWDYDSPITLPVTPTPLVKPTFPPFASPTPVPSEDNGIFGLGNTIKKIFLPSPDILYNEVNASKDLLLTKLHIDLDSFNPEKGGRPNNVTMTIYGQTVTLLDFEQIEGVAEQARTPINIVRVFVYIFALWGLIKFIIDYFNNRGGGNNA